MAAIDIDDSFKQPGMVPFSWEIKPGVPKPVSHDKPSSSKPRASPSLKPPPSSPTSSHFSSPRTQSSHFQFDNKPNNLDNRPEVVSLGCNPSSFHFPSPRTQSSRFQFDKANLGRPEVVSLGCFTPRRSTTSERKTNKVNNVDPVYKTELEMLSQWSCLTKRSSSRSHFKGGSPLSSSSFSSSRSSVSLSASDAEWAGYGLF